MVLVDLGLAESREKAQRLIRAGKVRLEDKILDKPGHRVAMDAALQVEDAQRFVSRGGEKLDAAMEGFKLDVGGRICVDIGASTGGFTDCLLQRGAAKVYAVDVGKGQLHWRLRQDSRVVVMEGENARFLTRSMFAEAPEFGVVDASFISLTLLLPAVVSVMAAGSRLVTLIKPQFEAGRELVGKGGVVRDPVVHQQVIDRIREFGRVELSLGWLGVLESPIRGPAGNVEFLAAWELA
ncbi:MAG TPA: TlyA family RNA methyltransferase [Kiritimatiellia bacterium]|nr:TlyA family RNA methyltransferase [Kiritimatiellia bacterium]